MVNVPNEKTAIDGLPDITEVIIEVYAHYDNGLKEANIFSRGVDKEAFVDAWFTCLKTNAIRLYYKRISDARLAEVSSSV